MANAAPLEKKDEKIQLRVNEFQKNRIKMLAEKHSGGNMTEWIIEQSTRIPGSKRIGGKLRPVKPKR